MAARLRELEERYESIIFVCSIMDWPWIRDAYMDQAPPPVTEEDVEETAIYAADPKTLLFLLGELPYITGLYERARSELDDDENLSVDGVKAMLLASRDRYQEDLGQRARKISPKLLRTYFQYVRNLSLIDRQFTPDLYTLITAARQIAGDQFAIHLAETASEYPFVGTIPYPTVQLGKRRARFPDESLAELKCRLPGRAFSWRTCRLQPKPPKPSQEEWQMRWNPFHQCSWPLEDLAIEKFRTHVKDVALALLGTDLARSEKFSASMKDGLDIRETLRNWHTGDLYVKVLPPSRGALDCVVMLFDSPADPREYPCASPGTPSTTTNPLSRCSPRSIAAIWSARGSVRPRTAAPCSCFRPAPSPTSGTIRGLTMSTRSKSGYWPQPACTPANGTSPF